MKLRLAIASLAIAFASIAVAWLTIQPIVGLLFDALAASPGAMKLLKWEDVLPGLLVLDVVLATGLVFLVLYFMFGIPLTRVEETIDQISRENTEVGLEGGPLVARLSQSLKRLSTALAIERAQNKKQLDELKASNEQLLRLQAELVAADRLATVGKLAAGVAHEVGNPLAGILGYLSVVRMRAKAPAGDLPEIVDRIEHEVQRIDQIVRSLLELGRPSRGRAQAMDVRPVIDSCVKLLSASRELEGITVAVEAPADLWLRAESGPLSQVLVNLVINAAQAMGGKGRIVIRAAATDSGGAITVEDEGPGLPPEVLARLFEPFFTTKPAGKGTGLGLAVSRHLLSQFEGELTAANRAGGGAAFTVTLKGP